VSVAVPDVIVIGGATASGKSAVALALAEALCGEVIGADSRQLYAGLRIAAAGPDDDDRRRAPHHLYGLVPPADTLTAGRFVALADAAIADVTARGRVAIVVGGTGLYLRALRLGLDDAVPADPALRAALHQRLQQEGLAALVDELRRLDEDAAAAVDGKNPVRVLRALERVHAGARAHHDVDALLQRAPRPVVARAWWLLVDVDAAVLAERIARRTAAMFATPAIVDEARALAGLLPAGHALLGTIGVAEALAVAAGALDEGGAVARVAARTRQYARRQRTWFRKEPWWTQLPGGDDDALVAAALARVG
jgi:tRNA dimethylallyltransferase